MNSSRSLLDSPSQAGYPEAPYPVCWKLSPGRKLGQWQGPACLLPNAQGSPCWLMSAFLQAVVSHLVYFLVVSGRRINPAPASYSFISQASSSSGAVFQTHFSLHGPTRALHSGWFRSPGVEPTGASYGTASRCHLAAPLDESSGLPVDPALQ